MASESCLSMLTEEEFLACVPLQNTERIIKVLATLYKESKMQTQDVIQMMRCMTYLKILCDCTEEYQLKYQSAIKDSLLIETMLETY